MSSKTTLFAFFTKAPKPVPPYEGYAKETWKETVRDNMRAPNAEVVLLEYTDWNAPTLTSIEPSEVQKMGTVIELGIEPVLSETYGISPYMIGNITFIPLLESHRVICVYPHTGEWGKRQEKPPEFNEVSCPSCGHKFVPPRVIVAPQAIYDKYGPNPVQCPNCKHVWGEDGKERSEPERPSLHPEPPAPASSRPYKSRSTALVLEILLGLFGLPGIGWIYSGRTAPGVILLVCYLIWDCIALAIVAGSSGVALLCTIPIGVLTVIISTVLLSNYMKKNLESIGTSEAVQSELGLEAEETVVMTIPANNTQGSLARGGRLWLTTRRLIFMPLTIEKTLRASSVNISLSQITGVGKVIAGSRPDAGFSGGVVDRLQVNVADGSEYLFVVDKPDSVASKIRLQKQINEVPVASEQLPQVARAESHATLNQLPQPVTVQSSSASDQTSNRESEGFVADHSHDVKILKSLQEKSRLLSASDLGLDDKSYALTLDAMVKANMITGVSIENDSTGKLQVTTTGIPKLAGAGESQLYAMYKASQVVKAIRGEKTEVSDEIRNPYATRIMDGLKEENRLLSASEVGLDNASYISTLEALVKLKIISGVSITMDNLTPKLQVSIVESPKLTHIGEMAYAMRKPSQPPQPVVAQSSSTSRGEEPKVSIETGNPYARRIVDGLKEENRLLSASELGLDSESYALTLEALVKLNTITGVSIQRDTSGKLQVSIVGSPRLTDIGETTYAMRKMMNRA